MPFLEGTNAEPPEELTQKLKENQELIAELSMSIAEKEARTDEINAIRAAALEVRRRRAALSLAPLVRTARVGYGYQYGGTVWSVWRRQEYPALG